MIKYSYIKVQEKKKVTKAYNFFQFIMTEKWKLGEFYPLRDQSNRLCKKSTYLNINEQYSNVKNIKRKKKLIKKEYIIIHIESK